jgi:hypothetical protein
VLRQMGVDVFAHILERFRASLNSHSF